MLVIVAGVALAGCTDDGGQETSDPGTDDGEAGEESPSDDGTGDDGGGDAGSEEDGGSDDGESSEDEQASSDPVEIDIQTPDAWANFKFDETRTQSFATSGSGTGDELYRTQIDANPEGKAAVANGLVYTTFTKQVSVTKTTSLLVGHDANTGEEVFTFQADGGLGTPLLAADGLVFAQTNDDGLYAIDEQGEVAWHNEGGDETAKITYADGLLYVVFAGDLHGIDAATGERQWSKSLEGFDDFSGYPVVQEERLLVPAEAGAGELFSLDPETREVQWVYDGEGSISTPVASVADGTAFLGADDQTIHAVDLDTGEREWVVNEGLVDATAPVLSDGNILVPNLTELKVLDSETGELVWEAEPVASSSDGEPQHGGLVREVVVTNETIYVWATGGASVHLAAFDPGTGEVEWSTPTHQTRSAFAIDGVLFSQGENDENAGELVALDAGYK